MNDPVPTALAELRCHQHWVVWRIGERDGKPTKIPYQAAAPRRKAKSDNPDTWAPYETAAEAVANGKAIGPGYVFAAHDEYAGVDLDKCVDEQGRIHPAAMEVVRKLNSYTEFSPSGTGLHIYVRASVATDGRKTENTPWGGALENYDERRFFTVTGRHLKGTPTTIEARQAELDDLRNQFFPPKKLKRDPQPGSNGKVIDDDSELLEKMFGSKNGSRLRALYDGDAGEYNDDDSSADLAFCNSLAWWTCRDAARMDRIFRTSGLMRDKWDSPRPGGTYGSQTIDKAIADCHECYGERLSLTRIFTKRDQSRRQACDDLADIFGLKTIGETFVRGVRSTQDSKGVVELFTDTGRRLRLDPLNAYSTAPKMAVEVSLQLGTRATTKDVMPTIFALIGAICELQEEVTLDERAADLGRTFMQEAPHGDVTMTDQGERWAAFLALKAKDPIVSAKANSTSIAAESLVLRDTSSGMRYVRVGWFAAYAKAQTGSEASRIVQRMPALGWRKAGRTTDGRGRLKATDPSGDRTLQWDFFEVQKGWEWS